MRKSAARIVETERAFHFYLPDGRYLGMLTQRGQLTDFRGEVLWRRRPTVLRARWVLRLLLKRCSARLVDRLLGELPEAPPPGERAGLVAALRGEIPALPLRVPMVRWGLATLLRPSFARRLWRLATLAAEQRRLARRHGPPRAPSGGEPAASREILAGLKDRFRGRRCFILGNGPSLNHVDLRRLAAEHTFGVNGIFHKTREMGFRPNYYVVEDSFVLADNLPVINALDYEWRFFPAMYRRLIRPQPGVVFLALDSGYYREFHPHFGAPDFSTDCSRVIYGGQTVTYLCLQLAFHLGFSTVYLLGMDHHYVVPRSTGVLGSDYYSREDDPNHFDPEYFGRGKRWHDPHLDRAENAYRVAKAAFEAHGRQVWNATAGGRLDVFPRTELARVLDG